ncbi:hypothetical protein HELRODRAFT_66050, partial [Helobdella robusta]|uniref:Uncharacterized protein n=1 Tax=Helobdella robusta TaxID=6412 RepID=T1FYG4_HELRO
QMPSPINENNSLVGQSKSLLANQKKSRNEVKKCRKVYGLENRAAWCTQCKWKKACTRFHEKSFDYS